MKEFDGLVMKALKKHGKPATSTEIADALKLTGESRRDKVRASMKRLSEAGKVKISLNTKAKRKQFSYKAVS